MGFEGMSGSQESRKSPTRSFVEAGVLAGALLAQPPAMAEDVEADVMIDEASVDQVDTTDIEEKRQGISFSEHEAGKRLPMDYDDALLQYELLKEEARQSRQDDLNAVSPEYKVQGNLDTMKAQSGFSEVLGRTREGLTQAINTVAEKTGGAPAYAIQTAGDMLVGKVLNKFDANLNQTFTNALMKGMTESDQEKWKLVKDSRYTGNMSFVRTISEGANQNGAWRLDVGADPGIELGSSKLDPKVGVTFRMSLP